MKKLFVVSNFIGVKPDAVVTPDNYTTVFETFSGLACDLVLTFVKDFNYNLFLKFIEDYKGNLDCYTLASPSNIFLSRFTSSENKVSFKRTDIVPENRIQRGLQVLSDNL